MTSTPATPTIATAHPQAEDGLAGGVTVTLIGGPTALIEIGGLRLLTDPTFDAPGDHPVGTRSLLKTRGPAIPVEDIGTIDAVLLSHDQHPDNLDNIGRRFVATVPLVLTTQEAAARLGGPSSALSPWRHTTLRRPDGRELHVIGVPAQHGPDHTEDLTGTVTGFVLAGEDLPTIYVSGDNASLSIAHDVVEHLGPIDIALLFAGAARTSLMDAYLTLTNDQAARAARILNATTVIPLHFEGWNHFTEGPETIADAFARHGQQDCLTPLAPGNSVQLQPDSGVWRGLPARSNDRASRDHIDSASTVAPRG
jgi:L-ascorbate metabolism protein UlaG (beta-lactamase superfamily)